MGHELPRIWKFNLNASTVCAAGSSTTISGATMDASTRTTAVVSAVSQPYKFAGSGWYDVSWAGVLYRDATSVDPPSVTVFGDSYAETTSSGQHVLDVTTATVTPTSANVTVDVQGGVAYTKLGQGNWDLSTYKIADLDSFYADDVVTQASLTYGVGATFGTAAWHGISKKSNTGERLAAVWELSDSTSWHINVPNAQFAWVRSYMSYPSTMFTYTGAVGNITDFALSIARIDESGLGPEPGDLAVRLMMTPWSDGGAVGTQANVDIDVQPYSDRYFVFHTPIYLPYGWLNLGVFPREAVTMQSPSLTVVKLSDG